MASSEQQAPWMCPFKADKAPGSVMMGEILSCAMQMVAMQAVCLIFQFTVTYIISKKHHVNQTKEKERTWNCEKHLADLSMAAR